MKRTAILSLTIFFFCYFHSYAQNKYTTINDGGVIIKLPYSFKEFIETNTTQREHFTIVNQPLSSLFTLFLDSSDISKYGNNISNKITIDKYIAVWDNMSSKRKNHFGKTFSIIKDAKIKELINKGEQKIDSTNFILYETKITNSSKDFDNTKVISYIYDSDNSLGLLMIYDRKNEAKDIRCLITRNMIKIKSNRILDVYISSIYNGQESINWITESSKNYTKSILEANK